MALIDWNDNLATGVSEIDRQHKHMLAMLNGLHEAMKAGKSRDMLAGLIGELKKYASVHFETEERLMERHGYPELDSHRAEHNRFIEKVLDYDLDLKDGAAPAPVDLMQFLKTWLSGHIQGTDQRYAPFFREKGLR